jgi:hypothetical protein
MFTIVNHRAAVFGQVGDGAFVIREGEDYRTIFWPEPGEYANSTDFLTDDRVADFLRFERIPGSICQVAALTDGLQRLSLNFSTKKPYPGFFGPAFDTLRATSNPESLLAPLRDFLESPRVNARTDDDKTLVLALRWK